MEKAQVSPLEEIVGSFKFERFLTGDQKTIDLRNVAAVAAARDGWSEAFNELIDGKIQVALPDGNIRELDFGREIRTSKYADDRTFFRPYVTLLFLTQQLTDKYEKEFSECQQVSNGITAHTVAQYASISLGDVQRCFGRYLVRDGYVVRDDVKNLDEWKTIADKATKEQDSIAKLAKIPAEKEKQIAKIRREAEQLIKRLDKLEFGTAGAEVQKAVNQRVEEVEKEYKVLEERLKISFTEEEREVWSYGRHLPKHYYRISEKGREVLQVIKNKYPAAWANLAGLWQELDKRISKLQPLHSISHRLGLAHILEEDLEKVSYAVFRELLYEWSQLPEERALLFKLYSIPFTFKTDDRTTQSELSYIGPTTPQSKIIASVYADSNDKILAHISGVAIPLGMLYMADAEKQELLNLAKTAAAAPALEIPTRYCMSLIDSLRSGKISLANVPAEREACQSLGLYRGDRVRPFGTKAGSKRVEAVKFYQEQTYLLIPEPLAASNSIVFLPKHFDPKGIKWRS